MSKKTEQLLACGRTMRVKLRRRSVIFARWGGVRTRDQWDLGSCGTPQLSLSSGVFSYLFLHEKKGGGGGEREMEQIDLLTFDRELHLLIEVVLRKRKVRL